MEEASAGMGLELMLDGNAAGGVLHETFGTEMTANPARCAHCGRVSMIGAMLAFGQEMGTALRCPHCLEMVMRVMAGPDAVWLDMRGMSHLRLMHTALQGRG